MNKPNMMNRADLLEWLRGKITEAEKALRAREEMERVWQCGSDEEWARVAALHPSTAGKPIKKADRLREAELQGRIAAKCRIDLEMLHAAYAAIQPDPN
jgi:hypothetical protein